MRFALRRALRTLRGGLFSRRYVITLPALLAVCGRREAQRGASAGDGDDPGAEGGVNLSSLAPCRSKVTPGGLTCPSSITNGKPIPTASSAARISIS